MAVGSMSGSLARRAKRERTGWGQKVDAVREGQVVPSTIDTTPERLAAREGGDGAASSDIKSLCELAEGRYYQWWCSGTDL